MPKRVSKLIGQLEEITTKIENLLDDITTSLGQAIDSLLELNDELDTQVEEE